MTRVAERVVPDTCEGNLGRFDFLETVPRLSRTDYCNFLRSLFTENVDVLFNGFVKDLFSGPSPQAALQCNQDRAEITQL